MITALLISIGGLLIFIWKFSKIKVYFCYLIDFYGAIYLIMLFNLLLSIIFLGQKVRLNSIIDFIIGFPKIVILGAVGIYFLRKSKFKISFNITKFSEKALIPIISDGFKLGIGLSLLSILVLYIKHEPIINPTNPSFLFISIWLSYSISLAVLQETYFRLFTLPFLNYFMRKIKYGLVYAVIIASLIPILMFYEYIGYDLYTMIQIFFCSIILSIVMIKKGWDTCIIGNTIFYFMNFIIFGNTIFLFKI